MVDRRDDSKWLSDLLYRSQNDGSISNEVKKMKTP